ncbi:hypothetical protein FRB99_001958, partial [Tulasnella sp. 403]
MTQGKPSTRPRRPTTDLTVSSSPATLVTRYVCPASTTTSRRGWNLATPGDSSFQYDVLRVRLARGLSRKTLPRRPSRRRFWTIGDNASCWRACQ